MNGTMVRRLAGALALALVIGLLAFGAGTALARGGVGGWGMPNGSGMMPGQQGMPMGQPYGGMGQGMMGMGSGMSGDVDRHYIEMMIPHHQAAIAMADLALNRAEHPELKQLAATIKQTQTAEIAQMRQWYQAWYGTDVPTVSMGSTMGGGMMGGGMMGGGMMGGDPAPLAGAQPFDRAFIEQMVPHHQMAVTMSQMMLPGVTHPELRGLLRSIVTGQTAEIDQMQQWYQTWYGTPLPASGHGMGMGAGSGTMPMMPHHTAPGSPATPSQ